MNDDGKWVTINGTHVFIKDGESVEQALSRLHDKDYVHEYIEVRKQWNDPYSAKIIHASDLSEYASKGFQKHSTVNLERAQKILDKLSELNPGLDVDRIEWELNRMLGQYPFTLAQKKMFRDYIMNRVAEHQQSLAQDYLKDVPKLSERDRNIVEDVNIGTNPNYKKSVDLRKQGSTEPEAAAYTYNCQRCVQAFVLRWVHGYDVKAKPCEKIWGQRSKEFINGEADNRLKTYVQNNGYRKLQNGSDTWYTNWNAAIFNADDVRKTHIDAWYIEDKVGYAGTEDQFRWIKKTVKEAGPGACYIATISWKGMEGGKYSGHTFCIINDKGKVKCLDPQSGEECSHYFTEKQIKSNRTEMFRADTCRLNGTIMKEVVEYE